MWAPYLKWNFSFPAVICSWRSHPPSEITWNITNPSPFIQQPHHFWIVLSGVILSLSLCHFSIDSLLYSKYIILASHISAFLLTLTISKTLLPFTQLAFQSSPSGPWLFSPLWRVLHGWLFRNPINDKLLWFRLSTVFCQEMSRIFSTHSEYPARYLTFQNPAL